MEELIHRIEQVASETQFSGVISIFTAASTVFSKAFGYRDIKNHLPNTTETVFGIASGTKFFTALGMGVLIDPRKRSFRISTSTARPYCGGSSVSGSAPLPRDSVLASAREKFMPGPDLPFSA